ncbi:MAG: polysaccharide biosynthesis tyrosine autokinase [Candidatus Omnitrophica bacterium]|nr:polysaccharide biosynthesis tyrosine autokinase [Candidatus Omnitrophota bacterium]
MKLSSPLSNKEELQLSFQDYWHIIRKRRRFAITFLVIVVCSTALYSILHPKIYKATTRILIERGDKNILSFDNMFPVQTAGIDYYPTQHRMLKSRAVAKRVMDHLNLWSQFAWASDPVEAFLRQVEIDPVRQSRLVDVSAFSTSPNQARETANAVVRFYVEQNLENKLSMKQQAAEWLAGKIAEMREKISQSELQFEWAKLKTELSELNEKYLPKHPEVIRAQSRIVAVEKQLGVKVIKSLEQEKLAALYNELQREVESGRKIYEQMLGRLKETTASEGVEDTNVIVIDPAEVPKQPVAPRFFLNIFLGFLVGIFGGGGFCLVFESLDNTLKSPEDIEKTAQLPVLGIVAKWNVRLKELMVHEDPTSGVAEAFRAIRTSLLFSSPDKPLRTLLVTSPHAQEGKTIVACNLAATIAQSGARVLLVDADMRKPRVHQVFGRANVQGLSHGLTTPTDAVSEFIDQTSIEGLSVLVCGSIPPTPSELLGSQKMKRLIEQLREQFDYVIFDSPPFMAVTDPVVLATLVDGVVFVTRYNKTQKDIMARGKQKFLEVQARVVGVILNAVDLNQERSHHLTYSYYYRPDREQDIVPPATVKLPQRQATIPSIQPTSRPTHHFPP